MSSSSSKKISMYVNPSNAVFEGFLIDFVTTVKSAFEPNTDKRIEQSGLELYFRTDKNKNYCVVYQFDPFLYVTLNDLSMWNDTASEIKRITKRIKRIERERMYDAEHPLFRFLYPSETDVMKVVFTTPNDIPKFSNEIEKVLNVKTVRENKIRFEVRVSVELGNNLKIGRHYKVSVRNNWVRDITESPLERLPDLPTLGWDIEVFKKPFKKPDFETDPIVMNGFRFNDLGIIIYNEDIISREEVDEHVTNSFLFKKGDFMGIEVRVIPTNEKGTIVKFLNFIKKLKPLVIGGYNSDNFDWNYIARRLSVLIHGDSSKYVEVMKEYGFRYAKYEDVFDLKGVIMLDAWHYVQKYSYLPKGQQTLKFATKKFFKVEPEDFTDIEDFNKSLTKGSDKYDPFSAFYYNASDFYFTYLILKKLMTAFGFSLTSDLPMRYFDAVRKGSLMVAKNYFLQESARWRILGKNVTDNDLGDRYKITSSTLKTMSTWKEFTKKLKTKTMTEYFKSLPKQPKDGYIVLIDSYEGGKVELNAKGLYRNDIDMEVKIDLDFIKNLSNNAEQHVDGIIEEYERDNNFTVTNRDECVATLKSQLNDLIASCVQKNGSSYYIGLILIIHNDVASLYPSLMMNENFQPYAIMTEHDCVTCDYKEADFNCQIKRPWIRKLKIMLATDEDIALAKSQFLQERSKNKDTTLNDVIKKVVKQKLKNKFSMEVKEEIEAMFCQKAHKFFSGRIRSLRKDRLVYKKAMKRVINEKIKYTKSRDPEDLKTAECKEQLFAYEFMITYNENTQLSKKIKINMLYGVMPIPFEWGDHRVAGCTTIRGQKVLMSGIDLFNHFSHLIEADTDGYYSALPITFPRFVHIKTNDPNESKPIAVSLLDYILNKNTRDKFTNYNNYEIVNTKEQWELGRDQWKHEPICDLVFERDGPYDLMFTQAKKKYIIYDKIKGKKEIAELKGSEIIRKGELGLIKKSTARIYDEAYSPPVLNSLKEGYQKAKDIVNEFLKQIDDCTLPIELIVEGRDVSDSSIRRINNAKTVLDALEKKGISEFPFNPNTLLKIQYLNDYKNKKDMENTRRIVRVLDLSPSDPLIELSNTDVNRIKTAYSNSNMGLKQGLGFVMAGFRTRDLGIDVPLDDSVRWIVSKYPVLKDVKITQTRGTELISIPCGISERTIPMIFFKYDKDTRKQFLKRWTGADVDDPTIENLVDWDYYKKRFLDMVNRVVVQPALEQKIDISFKEWGIDKKPKPKVVNKSHNIEKMMSTLPEPTPYGSSSTAKVVVKKTKKKNKMSLENFF